jgi:Arc/MetJ-type ribon-helix-helix transcriptional regulator
VTKKLSISVPDEVANAIQQLVNEGRADSVSSFLTAAAIKEIDRSAMSRVVIDAAMERAREKDPDGFERSRRKVAGWFGIERHD